MGLSGEIGTLNSPRQLSVVKITLEDYQIGSLKLVQELRRSLGDVRKGQRIRPVAFCGSCCSFRGRN